MSSIKYRPEIDGLRAVAVLPVLFFHLGFSWLPGGFLGVDVFFVISGFLITSIILRELELGSFTFSSFWIRRIRRITPVLFTVVATTLLISFFITYRPTLFTYAKDGLSTIFSYANIVMWQKAGDYWGAAAEASPFLHAWSLSVEEQFYLFFPIALFVFRKSRNLIFAFISVSVIVSFSCFIWGAKYSPEATFFLLPTRVWELGIGALIAMVPMRSMRSLISVKLGATVSSGALIVILISYVLLSGESGIPTLTILPVFGAGLFILFVRDNHLLSKILGSSIFVFIGKISYSLYLWHWPVIVLGREYCIKKGIHGDSVMMGALFALLSFALAIPSYYLIEQTTRRYKNIGRVVCPLAIISIVLCLAYLFIPFRYSTGQYSIMYNYMEAYDAGPGENPNGMTRAGRLKEEGAISPSRKVDSSTPWRTGGVQNPDLEGTPDVMLIGDSHAAMWGKLIDDLCVNRELKMTSFAMIWSDPFFHIPLRDNVKQTKRLSAEEVKEFYENILKKTVEWKPRLIIVSSRWAGRDDEDFAKLSDLVDFCENLGVHLLIMGQPPELHIGGNNATQYLSYIGLDPDPEGGFSYLPAKNLNIHRQKENKLRGLCQNYSNCTYVNLKDVFLSEGSVVVLSDTNITYYDDDHLSYAGTLLAEDVLSLALDEVLSITEIKL